MQLSLSNIKRTYKCSRIFKRDLLLTFKKKDELKEIDTGILFLNFFFLILTERSNALMYNK